MRPLSDLIAGVAGRIAGRKRNRPGPRILLYHRVYSPTRDPQLLCVSEENFAAQMEVLASSCDVYPVQQLLQLDPAGREYRNAVAITFDDGYFDNFAFAEPILRARALPATVFVSSGFVDGSREMWWDELERLLLSDQAATADQVVLEVNGVEQVWKTTGGAGDSSWNVTRPPDTAAQLAYMELAAILKWLDPNERETVLREIRAQLFVEEKVRESHRGMSREELSALSSGGIMEVGGHTCDHVALSAMSPEVQSDQIRRDKAVLETLLGHKVGGFAYPYGTETEVDHTTMNQVQNAGYEYACVNIPSPFAARENNFAIPRHLVRNWPAAEFSRNYRVWQGSEA